MVSNGASAIVINPVGNSTTYLSAARNATIDTQWDITVDETAFQFDNWFNTTNAVMATNFGVEVDNTPYPIRWSINELTRRLRIDGTFRVNINTAGTPICLLSAPIVPVPTSARSGPTIPCFNANGDCVGSIQLVGLTTPKNLLFTANVFYAVGEIIRTNGTLNID